MADLGACIGDALAAPIHWYYDLGRMRSDTRESFPNHAEDEKGRLTAFCKVPSSLNALFISYKPLIDPLGIVHGKEAT